MIKTIVMTMVACYCLQVHAQVVAIDGKWLAFDIDEAISLSGGGEWIDLDGNALRYEIDLERPALLILILPASGSTSTLLLLIAVTVAA